MTNIPKNEIEFDLLMKEIDENLKEQKIPITARQLHAAGEVSKRLKIDVPIVGNKYAIKEKYSGKSLGAHIKNWYEKKYGSKLKVNFNIGEIIITIKKDPYKLKIPRIYGKATLVNDRSLKKYPNHPININGLERKTLIINVLNYIDGITPKLAQELNDKELKNIMHFFIENFKSFNNLETKKNLSYKDEAISDLKTAVNNILSSPSQPGMSKWASLQFAEKIMKGFLKYKLKNIPHTHNLSKLNKMFKNQNITEIPADILEDIQCRPKVRYGDTSVTLLEAIKAHHASLSILYYLFN